MVIAASENGCAGTRVPAVPEGGHQHRRRQRARIGEPVSVPAVGIPESQAGRSRGVEQRQQRGDRPARRHVDDARAGVERDRFQHGAGHDRTLRQPGALQRAALGELGVTGGDAARSLGVLDRSTSAQPSAAIRFDIDAMWISATSMRDAAEADVRRLRRPRRRRSGRTARRRMAALESSCAHSALRRRRPPRRARRARPACPTRRRPPWHRGARTRPSRRGRRTRAPAARTRLRRRSPGPAHDARPMRWPSRRVSANRSTDPRSPSSASVASSARSRLREVGRDVVAAEQRARQQCAGPRTPRRAACAAASGSRRRPCWPTPRAARRTTRRRSART